MVQGKNMLFDDEAVRQLYTYAEEEIPSAGSLLPNVPKSILNSAFTEVVKDIANDDPALRRLAQQLSDSVDGIGMVSALKLLAMCGMVMGKRGKG